MTQFQKRFSLAFAGICLSLGMWTGARIGGNDDATPPASRATWKLAELLPAASKPQPAADNSCIFFIGENAGAADARLVGIWLLKVEPEAHTAELLGIDPQPAHTAAFAADPATLPLMLAPQLGQLVPRYAIASPAALVQMSDGIGPARLQGQWLGGEAMRNYVSEPPAAAERLLRGAAAAQAMIAHAAVRSGAIDPLALVSLLGADACGSNVLPALVQQLWPLPPQNIRVRIMPAQAG